MSTDPYTQEPEEIGDSSKYMRTYAKDMAALSGKGAPAKAVPPPPPPAPKETTTDGVGLPEVDESLITQDRLQKTGDEPIDLNDTPTSGSVSVFEQKTPATAPTPTPLGPSINPERDAVLARLRAKVAQPKPSFEEPKTEVPRIPPVSKPAPPPPPAPAPAKPERFHSFSTDAATRIDQKRESKFSVLAAQADRTRRTVTLPARRNGPSIKPSAVLAGVFIVLGIGLIGVSSYVVLTRPGEVSVLPGVPSLIDADETMKLEGVSGPELMRALRDAADEPLVAGNVLVVYTASASSSPKGIPFETPEPGGVLVKSLPLLAPDILLRNVRPESTVGVIHAGDETRPFFILKVSSFERTFAGMLAWERDMRAALSTLYPEYPNAPVDEVSVGTTTPATASLAPQGFVDAIVRNYDVRILRDSGGRSLILYGYRDKETLIIARDEAAFLELVSRLDAKGQ